MTLLEKLARADKENKVTKRDGTLTNRAVDALTLRTDNENRFYPTYVVGSGRFTTNSTNGSIGTIIALLGFKFTVGNDSPRGGKTGDFIRVSESTFQKLVEMANLLPAMSKRNYQKNFKIAIKEGYWSDAISELNSECIRLRGYTTYKKWEAEVLRETQK